MMTDSQLDLSGLAIARPKHDDESSSGLPPPRSRWVSRYAIPLCILGGFFLLLAAAAGKQWIPKPTVTVIPVIVKEGLNQQSGRPMFQAAGWIEPRPTAVRVAALAPGVIDELLVVEGELVEKDEPIARLIAIDAELALQQAMATQAIRAGELQRAEAELAASITRLEKPVHLKVELADARSLLAKATTEKDKLPQLIKAAEAEVTFTAASLAAKRAAINAIAGLVLEEAARNHAAAEAGLEELRVRGPNLDREISTLRDKCDATEEMLQLLVEERRQVAEAKAKVASATALNDEAKVRLKLAELTLARTVVRAPMSGRILRLVASPGTRVMGLTHTAAQSSSTVVEMYDPKHMQVRADVRLEDVPKIVLRAPVEIQTASSAETIRGRVLQPTSSANIQKNTLEVKVELIDPPPTVSPEMLVTALFLAPERSATQDPESHQNGIDRPKDSPRSNRLLVPKSLVVSDGGQPHVWIVDAGGHAQKRAVAIGGTIDGSMADRLVEITQGLNVTDKLIATQSESLNPGDAVEVAGEETSPGSER